MKTAPFYRAWKKLHVQRFIPVRQTVVANDTISWKEASTRQPLLQMDLRGNLTHVQLITASEVKRAEEGLISLTL